jgi:hypothetical protein
MRTMVLDGAGIFTYKIWVIFWVNFVVNIPAWSIWDVCLHDFVRRKG